MADEFGGDFITKLAAMQQQAKFRPGGGGGPHPTVVGGGGSFEHPGSLTSRTHNMTADVDVMKIAQLLGYKTPKEKEEIYEKMYGRLQDMDPKTREKMMQHPDFYKMYKAMHVAGYPVMPNEKGYFDFLPPSAAARMAKDKPNEAVIATGVYNEPGGPDYSGNLAKYRKDIGGQSETDILALPDTDPKKQAFLSGKKQYAEAGVTPQQKQMNELMMEHQRKTNVELQQKIDESPEEHKARMKRFEEETGTFSAHAKALNAESELKIAQAGDIKDGYGKNPALQDANKAFLMNQDNIFRTYSSMESGKGLKKEENRFNMNKEFAGMAGSHIALVQAESKNARMTEVLSNVSLIPTFNRFDMEFDMLSKQHTKMWEKQPQGTEQSSPDEAERMKVHKLSYIQMASQLLQQSGNRSPEYIGKIVKWCVQVGDDPKRQDMLIGQHLGPLQLNDEQFKEALKVETAEQRKKKGGSSAVQTPVAVPGQKQEASPSDVRTDSDIPAM